EQTVLATEGAGLYWAAGVSGDHLEIRVEAEVEDPAALCAAVAERVTAEFAVPASVAPIDRAQVRRAMDRMLKPGSLTIEDLEAVS
ncbi:phenylacetate--CoA ligase family protein, partial [Kitasatospora sp. NPDC058263]